MHVFRHAHPGHPLPTYARVQRRRLVRLVCLIALIAASLASDRLRAQTTQSDPAVAVTAIAPELEVLRRHVFTLAGAEFQGRGAEGRMRTVNYLEDQFRALGLRPLFGDAFRQPFANPEGAVLGYNVGAILHPKGRVSKPGDPSGSEKIVVAAHHDHFGLRHDRMYPGADDNATGVAMMLETARALSKEADRLQRDVVFIAFDREEDGLWGSRYFVDHPPFPTSEIRLLLVADMLGRAIRGGRADRVFLMGSERLPDWLPVVNDATRGLPLHQGVLGIDIVGARSDYAPFQWRKVPFLFFSSGESPVYHSPEDRPETIDYPKLTAASRWIHRIARYAAITAKPPAGRCDPPRYAIDEARTIREVLAELLDHREAVGLKSWQIRVMEHAVSQIDPVIARGTATEAERNFYVRIAKIVLLSAL